jgi:hypothetical protein
MSVKIIQSRDHILNTYSEKISEFAEVSCLNASLGKFWSLICFIGVETIRKVGDRGREECSVGHHTAYEEVFDSCPAVCFSVKEVFTDKVVVTLKDPKDKNAKPIEREIPAGFVLWSTGIGKFTIK